MFKLLFATAAMFFSLNAYAVCATSECLTYRADFDTLIKHYKDVYCYADLKQAQHKKNFDELAQQYFDQLNDEMSANDYIWHLRKWGAEFHDGHVNFRPGTSGLSYLVTKFNISLAVLQPATSQETLVVTASTDQRIPVGSIVNQINGKLATDVVTEVSGYFSGSTDRMVRRNAAIGVLSAVTFTNKTVRHLLHITTPNKQTEQLEVQGVHLPYDSDPKPSESQTVKYEILSGGILHITISQFIGPDYEYEGGTAEEFMLMMERLDLTQVKAIVLDLRRNRGGSTTEYETILGYFTKNAIHTYNTSPRINDTTIDYRPALKNWPLISGTDYGAWRIQSGQSAYEPSLAHLPLITLISPYCFSACDTFVAALKSNKIGTLIGEPTAGGTGTPIVFDLPGSGHEFRYSTVRGKTLEDTYIEGVGTQPDIYIPQTAKDIQDQRDYQLEAAIAHFTPHTLSLVHRLPMRKLAKPTVHPLKLSAEAYVQYLSNAKE